MRILKSFFFCVVFLCANSNAEEPVIQTSPAEEAPQSGLTEVRQDISNPERILPVERSQSSQSAYFGKKTDRPVSAHKVNYFSINHWPGENNAQVKFQISMKFRLLEPDLYVLKYNLFPAYIAYSQKSLWNEGQASMPFEESNYNPEVFLEYPVNAAIMGDVKLRGIVISPLEHESNGLTGARSRSWSKQYLLIKFGLETKEELGIENSFLSDKASLYVKLWHAVGYSDQNDYLKSIGSADNFLDYMGRGEIGVSVRNFIWGGSLKNHQFDIRTPILRDSNKSSYEFEFRQQLPNMNFALYLQYWHGYGETLLRFDQFQRRYFAGLSFSY